MPTLSPVRRRGSARGEYTSRFTEMIPEIRYYVDSAINLPTQRSKNRVAARVIANAFDIFNRLGENGLGALAYPRPLAMAALVRFRQTNC